MDAPQISTLDEPQSQQLDDASPRPVSPQATRSSPRVARNKTQNEDKDDQQVYVVEDDDEEDQLIDDDDAAANEDATTAASDSRAKFASVAVVPPSAPFKRTPPAVAAPAPSTLPPPPPLPELHQPQQPLQFAPASYQPPPPPPATSTASTSTPRKRKPRKQPDGTSTFSSIPTPEPPVPAPTTFINANVPKKRRRTAIKATLEVERQEPETHDNTGTTSAWRLDSAGPAIAVGQMTVTQYNGGPSAQQVEEVNVKPVVAAAPVKRKRQPKVVVATGTPEADAPRKRVRTKASAPNVQETFIKSEANYSSYQSQITPADIPTPPEAIIDSPFAPYGVQNPNGPPTHVDTFQVPEAFPIEESLLAAAPLRPIPHSTNAVSQPNYAPSQAYVYPLEKTGQRCRKWVLARRSVRSIGGGMWFTGSWLGGPQSEVDHSKPPIIVEVPAPTATSTVMSATTADGKPLKVPKVPKPRGRRPKKDLAGAGGGGSSAGATPLAGTPTPSVVMEL